VEQKTHNKKREELCRFNLKDYDPSFDSTIDQVVQIFGENEMDFNKETQVSSACFVLQSAKNQQVFVFVVVYHPEMGAQIVPLHRTKSSYLVLVSNDDDKTTASAKLNETEILVKENATEEKENEKTFLLLKLHPFAVKKL
jgi:hypothetical protein